MKKKLLTLFYCILLSTTVLSQVICNNCNSACPACGFSSNPTISQVTSGCPDYPFNPPIFSNQSATRCASFNATNSTVSFNVIIQSDCGPTGNVSAFSWTLQSASCGSILQSGNLSNLTFNSLTVGNNYVFCYTFTVPDPNGPSTCSHTTHWPYFVGAQIVTPIDLLYFNVVNIDRKNKIEWKTANEIKNKEFLIERSSDGYIWNIIKKIPSKTTENTYIEYDYSYNKEINYYRIKQVDFDGKYKYYDIVSIDNRNTEENKPKRILNISGLDVEESYSGLKVFIYEDGTIIKRF